MTSRSSTLAGPSGNFTLYSRRCAITVAKETQVKATPAPKHIHGVVEGLFKKWSQRCKILASHGRFHCAHIGDVTHARTQSPVHRQRTSTTSVQTLSSQWDTWYPRNARTRHKRGEKPTTQKGTEGGDQTSDPNPKLYTSHPTPTHQ